MNIREIAVASIAVAGFAVVARADAPLSSLSYAQEGLIAQWDARENVGRGQHSDETTEWINLVDPAKYKLTWSVISGSARPHWEPTSAVFTRTANQPGAGRFAAGADIAGLGEAMGAEWTVEVVAKPTQGYRENYSGMCGCDSATVAPYLGQWEGGIIRFRTWNTFTGANGFEVPSDSVPLDELCTFAFGDSPTELYLCTNGVPFETKTNGAETNSKIVGLGAWTIGAASLNTDRLFSGQIYCVRVYNRKLTSAEVAEHARIDAARFADQALVSLEVVGSPSNYAVNRMTPAYGLSNHVVGDEVEFSGPSEPVEVYRSLTAVSNATITGWALLKKATDDAEFAPWLSGDTSSGSVTVPACAGLRLVWNWEVTGKEIKTKIADYASLKAYPQKGLYAHWDALQNLKQGGEIVHDPTTRVWSDLVGSHDLTYTGSEIPTWSANGYVSVKEGVKYMATAADADFLRNMGESWTVQTYVTPTADWLSGYTAVCGYHSVSDFGVNGLFFGQFGNANIRFVIYRAQTERTQMGVSYQTFQPFANRPLLLTMTATPVSCKVYLNEQMLQEVPTREVGDTLLTAPAFFVGNSFDSPNENHIFTGQIHSVRLYSRALTLEEISRSFAVDSSRFVPTETRDYVFLDYVEANGTQQLNTKVVPYAGLGVDVELEAPSDPALLDEHGIFGTEWTAQGFMLMFYHGAIRFHSGNVYEDLAQGSWQPGERLRFHGSNRGYEVNGAGYDFGARATGDKIGDIQLFNPGLRGGSFKLYRFTARDCNGHLLRDFYPARQVSTGTVGLYDAVEEKFYPPNRGVLAAGPDLTDVQAAVTLREVGRTSANFAIVPLVPGADSTDVVAVFTHDGRTDSLAIASFDAESTGVRTGILDGLKPDTDYQVYFQVGASRCPAGEETISFRTQPEVLASESYTPLDYIQSTGNESFNTRVMVSEPIAAAVDFTPHDSTAFADNVLFGSALTQAGFLMQFYQGSVRFHTGGAWTDIAPGDATWRAGERMTLLGTREGFFVNDCWTPLKGAGDAPGPLVILSATSLGANRNRGIVQLHGCVISNRLGGVLRDYVPVRRNADGLLGLFDRVNGTFSRSEDLYTGWFVAGNTVEAPWLKAVNALYTGRRLEVTLTRSAGEAAEIYAVWGETYGADDVSAWDASAKVGAFAADATAVGVTVKPLLPTTKYVRFYTSDGRWSESFTLADVKLASGMILLVR